MLQRVAVSIVVLLGSFSAFAADVPGGLTRTADISKPNTYELLISPSYRMSPSGAYLSSEIRHQYNEDLGAGFGFGAGETGFNLGFNGTWYIAPDLATQPAVALLGGIYFNRLESANYFVVKVAPVVSKTFKLDAGTITPYGGLHMAPAFRLGLAANTFSMKMSLGSEFVLKSFSGLRFWTEFGLGLVQSAHEVVVGLSYPFTAL